MRASYRAAIEWLALNDDTEWLDDGPGAAPSVSACLVADLFGKTDKQVRDALLRKQRELAKETTHAR